MSLVRENVLSAVLDDIVTVVRAATRVGGCGWVLVSVLFVRGVWVKHRGPSLNFSTTTKWRPSLAKFNFRDGIILSPIHARLFSLYLKDLAPSIFQNLRKRAVSTPRKYFKGAPGFQKSPGVDFFF